MPNHDSQLDELFVAYRAACPEVEASKNFMPGIWARIEARRKAETIFYRWVNSFAGAAAAVVLVLGLMLYQQPNPLPQRAYIEKLTDEISEDHFLEAAYVAQTSSYQGR
jgi:hypothetical protein